MRGSRPMTGLVDFLQAGCTAWSTHRSRQVGSGTAGQAQPKEGQLFLFGRRGGKGEGGNKSPDKTPISHPHTLTPFCSTDLAPAQQRSSNIPFPAVSSSSVRLQQRALPLRTPPRSEDPARRWWPARGTSRRGEEGSKSPAIREPHMLTGRPPQVLRVQDRRHKRQHVCFRSY